jgi:hypothetical protein
MLDEDVIDIPLRQGYQHLYIDIRTKGKPSE